MWSSARCRDYISPSLITGNILQFPGHHLKISENVSRHCLRLAKAMYVIAVGHIIIIAITKQNKIDNSKKMTIKPHLPRALLSTE